MTRGALNSARAAGYMINRSGITGRLCELFGEMNVAAFGGDFGAPVVAPAAAAVKTIQAIPTAMMRHVRFDFGETRFHLREIDSLVRDQVRLEVFAKPPRFDELVAMHHAAPTVSFPGVLGGGFLEDDTPRAESEQPPVTRRPAESFHFAKGNDARMQHDRVTRAMVHERAVARPNAAVHSCKNGPENLRVWAPVDAIRQDIRFYPPSLKGALKWHDGRVLLRMTQPLRLALEAA